jgi:YesN/AraC family two-component response regulator
MPIIEPTDIISKLVISDVRSANTLYNSKNAKGNETNKQEWAIAIYYNGETIYTNNHQKFLLDENNLIFLPKGSNYTWKCTRGGHITIIHFQANLTHNELLSFPISNPKKILDKFKLAEIWGHKTDSSYKINQIKLVYDIICSVINHNKKYQPTTKTQKLKPAIDYITTYYYKDITNDLLANLCNISTVYFRKLFSEYYHISPMHFVYKLRIEQAKQMLVGDFSKIYDIALSVGFSDVYHFSKIFKKYTNLSPTEYIHFHKNKQPIK